MISFRQSLAILSTLFSLLAVILPLAEINNEAVSLWSDSGLGAFALVSILASVAIILNRLSGWIADLVLVILPHAGAWMLLARLDIADQHLTAGFWCLVVSAWLMAWILVDQLSAKKSNTPATKRFYSIVVPVLFGVWLLLLWELVVRGLEIPTVLLPPPSMIGARFVASTDILWADFQQTFLKAVLIGYVLGCGSAFITAILIDRSPFLQRGLLPIGNLVSALPIIGVAPIMVMWFGFDWHSKAAVVIIMTFFPMLVNTVAGLSITSSIEKDMMKTYAASYWQSLIKLRLPSALPFIFNALKINSTLAMIGAIVAEFFGTPIVGMGFRISTEVGRMNVDMVWAEIAVAAIAGTAFYGIMVVIERACTFWHPSFRSSR
ncbi:nitrate ABC transporter [Kiloniella litopenaei]|uniref:Nitrate ABC transporter n=1 Tax=Kiloniella litopenaei TaxID=1549748 RepID=A0A0M2RDK2_9PROT|nr:ABC transporter permease [Kiloniella litopenaei]KKJ78539.1 nitrate ABC transporter [Kiloniella litopenaei]